MMVDRILDNWFIIYKKKIYYVLTKKKIDKDYQKKRNQRYG